MLDWLADLFDWAGGRFWDLKIFFEWFNIGGWYPGLWAASICEGLAYFCWGSRDAVRNFRNWIEYQVWYWRWQWEILKARLDYYWTEFISKLGDTISFVWGWLRQKAEEAWNKVVQIWDLVYSWVQPFLGLLWDRFHQFKDWVENTAIPTIQAQLTNLGTLLDQARADLGSLIDYQRQRLDQLNPFRESWEFIRNSYQKLTFTFETAWGKLGAFLTDPPGSVWAWLEPILLDRLEQFFNERWDQPK